MYVLVRYGEIGLKSAQVRSGFETTLRQNLQRKLDAKDISGVIVEREDRIFANIEHDEDATDAALALANVPGVVSVSPVVATGLEMSNITETVLDAVESELDDELLATIREAKDAAVEAENEPDADPEAVKETVLEGTELPSFAVDARRAGEHEYTSKDIENEAGQAIVDTFELPVDLDDPDLTVYVEARYKHAYVYTRRIDGVGGLPVDDRNNVVLLMTDRTATVAAYNLLKRGCTVYPVYTGHEADNLEEDMETLRQFDPDVKLTVLKGADSADALNQCLELYEADTVALPYTADELLEQLDAVVDDLDVAPGAVLLPNSGADIEQVLETYHRISYVPA